MQRQQFHESRRRQPEGFRFFAYVDTGGMLVVKAYRSWEEYCSVRRQSDVVETTKVFPASGHVEARRIAKEMIGHLERQTDIADLFGPADGAGDVDGGEGG